MTTSNSTVNTVPVSVSQNSTKKEANDLSTVVLGHRKDKSSASKTIANLQGSVGTIVRDSKSTDVDVKWAFEKAKKEINDNLDRIMARALSVKGISQSTTGKGGMHWQDVVTELFAATKKSEAVAKNTEALRSAGLI